MLRHARFHRRLLYRLLTWVVFVCSCFIVYVICIFLQGGKFKSKEDLHGNFSTDFRSLVQKESHILPGIVVTEGNETKDRSIFNVKNSGAVIGKYATKVETKGPSANRQAKVQKPIRCDNSPMIERRRYIQTLRSFVNPHDVTVTLSAERVCRGASHPYLLIVCLSLPSHFEMRETIRTTWASTAKSNSDTETVKQKVEIVFVVGLADSQRNHTLLTEESNKYGDILQGDFQEEYSLITRKVLLGFKWMVDNCKQASFLMKVDEDVYVNLPQILEMLRTKASDRPAVIGYKHATGKVFRVGNWGVSYEQYKFCHYLPYVEGNSYVISGRLVAPLFNISQYHPYMATEDAYITGLLREMIGAPIHSDRGFATFAKKLKIRNRETFKNFYRLKMLSETRCTAGDMRNLWSVYNEIYKPG